MDTILIVDDEDYIREELAAIIESEERNIIFAENGRQALTQLEENAVDIIMTDIRMPEMDGFELIKKVKQDQPAIPIITITAFASTETAVQALRLGAYDYVTKPFSIDEIRNIVDHALQAQHLFNEVTYLRGRLGEKYSLDNIIGQCSTMQKVYDTIQRVANAACSILITGESGTGKDLVAQAIHEHSERKGKFVPINCGSIPEGLLESELFGHVKGSFSGAVSEKQGLVQTADGGTLFLDEIGDMPIALQVKLLRLIQNRQVQKVGSTNQEKVDVRIITATNQSLTEHIVQKSFRKDLYYRINVVEINLPPLRERGSDITLLAWHFIKKYSVVTGKTIDQISPEVMNIFQRYPWPGNVRELENAIERAVTLCEEPVIGLEDIPATISDFSRQQSCMAGTLHERIEAFEMECIRQSLENNNYDFNLTAEDLSISLATLYRKIKKFEGNQKRKIKDLEKRPSNVQYLPFEAY